MKTTSKIMVYFRNKRSKMNTISILGEEVEVMGDYRYVGAHMGNRLFTLRDRVVYFLKKFRCSSVCSKVLQTFCKLCFGDESNISCSHLFGKQHQSQQLKESNHTDREG